LNKVQKAKYDGLLRQQTTTAQAASVPLPVARQVVQPVPMASTSNPSAAAPVHFDARRSVRPSVRRNKSSHGPIVVSVACTLAVVVALVVFWRSQEGQNAAPSAENQGSGVAVAKVKKNADPTVSPPPAEQRADASALDDSLPGEPDEPPGEIDPAASETPAEPATDEPPAETETPDPETEAPADQPADDETMPSTPSEEPEPASAGKKSSNKPKRPSRAKKTATPKRPRLVPKEAILNNGHWYWFSENKATPEEAQLHAFNLDGRLVTISSAQENEFLVGHLKGPTFIGMMKVKGVWINSAGGGQGYFNWDRGQPSSTKNEIYAAIHPKGAWHDYYRDSLYYCIEWGPEP
jgi:glucan-binding YG repeat protein